MKNNMKSCWCLVLFLSMLSYQVKFVNNSIIPIIQELQYFHKYDEVLITLLQDVQLRNIIVFDNSSTSSMAYALSNLPTSIGILLKSELELDKKHYTKEKKDPIEIQGVVLIMNDGRKWNILYENLLLFWELNNKCVIIIMAKLDNACPASTMIMQDIARLHFAQTFFICMDPKFTEPLIYTHDLYGDTKPSNWFKVQQSPVMLRNWTMYCRVFQKVMFDDWANIVNICRCWPSRETLLDDNTMPAMSYMDNSIFYIDYFCFVLLSFIHKERIHPVNTFKLDDNTDIPKGFNFNRTDVRENPRAMMSVYRERESKEVRRYIYDGDARNLDEIEIIDEIIALERILNMKFTYLVDLFPVGYYSRQRPMNVFVVSEADIIINDLISSGKSSYVELSYPTYYDHYIILSRDRGPATPLEKIADFYGIWTLVSLIIVLILTIIVIWFKTNGRLSLAFFDSLRLLINSGIVTPIDTLPLKIFFLMIFLYFIVIQSTFSGELSKFLTIPAYLDNIDTLDDLTQSRVRFVHGYFFTLDNQLDNYKVIAKKYIPEETSSTCFQAVMKNPNDVCIGQYWAFLRTIFYRNLTGYYISKNKLSGMQAHAKFRPRFPFIEKINWGLIALSETRIYHRSTMEENEMIIQKVQRMNARNRQHFRPISFQDLKFALILLLIGNSISFIVFLLELSTSQYQEIIKKVQRLWQTVRHRKKVQHIRVQKIRVRPIK